MKEFKIGNWIIGPLLNTPIKMRELSESGVDLECQMPDGSISRINLCPGDRIATPLEIAESLLECYLEAISDEQLDLIEGFDYNEEEDSLKANGITIYRDSKWIEIL